MCVNKKLEAWEGRSQRDFLSMDRGEWEAFVDALEAAAKRKPDGWEEVENFLRYHGLYVFLALDDLRFAAEELYQRKRLFEIAKGIVERVVEMEVIAALQPPAPGLGGRAYLWPPSEEGRLLKIYEEGDFFGDLALGLLRAYGPCVLVEADDDVDYALLAVKPSARGGGR